MIQAPLAAAAAALQPHPPARRAEAMLAGRRFAGRRGDPPAARRRRAGFLAALAPERAPAKHEAGGQALLASELQPPTGDEIDALDFADGGDDARRAQRVLQHRQHLGRVPRADLDQAVGRKAEPDEARRVQVVPPQDPDQLAAFGQRRGEPGDEGGAGRARLQLQPVPDELVPAPEAEPPARKRPSTRPSPNGRYLARRGQGAFQRGDLGAQGGQASLVESGHRSNIVLILF